MKNYLVGAVRPVSKVWGYWKQDLPKDQAQQGADQYQAMYDISRASARRFLQGDWEEVKFSAPVLDARLYQIAQWYTIKELWFREPCNILCMGADTLFIRPTEIFGHYSNMMMFNYTDPRKHKEFEHYFNDDIRYYPADMNSQVWEVGEEAMNGWFDHKENIWGWGQLVHNYQLWSQGLSINDVLDPKMAYQAFSLNQQHSDQWNSISVNQAHIMHFHGSRDCDSRLDVMKNLADQLKI
jgi:hypothetical protein